jgi:hypothetical protein
MIEMTSTIDHMQCVELQLFINSKGKGKVFPVLFLTEHHAMKAYYWGSGGIAPCILDLSTRWSMVSFTPWPLYPREIASGAHWIGGWMGSRASLDAVVRRKLPSPSQDSNLQSSSP